MPIVAESTFERLVRALLDEHEPPAWEVSSDHGCDAVPWAIPGVPREGASPEPTSLATDPGPEVRALVAAVDGLAALDPATMPEPVALAATRVLLQQTERIKALALRSLTDVDSRQLFALDDAPSAAAWVHGLGVPGVDRSDLTLSRRLRKVPQISTELAAGRMSSATAATLTRAILKARPFLDRVDGLIDGMDGEQTLEGVIVDGVTTLIAEQIGGAADAGERLAALQDELAELNDPGRTQQSRWEAALIVFARETDPALLASGTALLLDALLPNEHDRRAAQAEEDCGLDLHKNSLGPGWRVNGDLDDLTGEMLATALAAGAATDPDNPEDTARHADGRERVGDDLPPEDWPVQQPRPRSKRQQRHDAFKRGLQALLDSGALGVRGKATPHVAVTTSQDFVEAVPGSLPGRTDHGARLSRAQVRQLLCRSTFTRLVLDARRRVIEVSHTQRTSTALERLLLKVQGGCICSGRGCARGPATGHRLIPHHGSLFSVTGTTQLDDIVLLCEPEHDHELHQKRRTLTLKDGRILGPDGWVRR